jgi:hypothetical protein
MPDEFEPSHEPTASDIGSERPPQSERDRPDPASRFEAETAKSPRQQRQEDFLAAYANCDNITRAAEMAGIDRTTHHVWLREDPSYANRFERAQDEAADRLEFEAVRRVLEGDEVPVFYRGKQVGVRKEYSDKLLMFLLKTARPEKFGDAADLPAGAAKSRSRWFGIVPTSRRPRHRRRWSWTRAPAADRMHFWPPTPSPASLRTLHEPPRSIAPRITSGST